MPSRPAGTPEDVAWARRAAAFYLSKGWNALPSSSRRKCPTISYGRFWREPVPASLWDEPCAWTTNVQVMTGVRGPIVVDLDGEPASRWWDAITRDAELPPHWESGRGQGGSRHLWFSPPPGLESCPSRVIWKGGQDHVQAEILADKKLVVAPPSLHVDTGERYVFRSGKGPRDLASPAPAPDWLVRFPAVQPDRPAPPPRPRRLTAWEPGGEYRFDSRAVYDCLRGRFREAARELGLELFGGPNAAGWTACRAVGRDDRDPSASFSEQTGAYSECGSRPIPFFTLAALLRPETFRDWRDAVEWAGDRFGAPARAITPAACRRRPGLPVPGRGDRLGRDRAVHRPAGAPAA